MSAAKTAVEPIKSGASANMLTVIAQAAADPRVDVIKMTALLELQQKLLDREAEGEFTRALVRMNVEDLRVSKNGTVSLGSGGKTSYKFAKWEDMDKVIRPLMRQEGFVLSFDTAINPNGGMIISGTLLHEGGYSRTASIPLALDTGPGRNSLQAMGSTVSYGKRYVTEMLLNVVREDEDDDGQTGGYVQPPPPSPRPTRVYDATPLEPREPPVSKTIVERAETALTEPNGSRWLKILDAILLQAEVMDDVNAIHGLPSVQKAMAGAPTLIKAQIDDMFKSAIDRLSAGAPEQDWDEPPADEAKAAAPPDDDFPGDKA